MKVRPAIMNEIPAVSALWFDMIKEEFGEDSTPDARLWSEIFVNRMMYEPEFDMLVAENGDGIVGYISGHVYSEPSDGKIHGISQSIYVKPQYRNGRIGLILYHNLAKTFVKQGAQIIEFLCKADRISFWNKKGYECKQVVMSMNARKLSEAYGG